MFDKNHLKVFEVTLLVMLIADILSFFTVTLPAWQNFLWAAVVFFALAFSLKDLRWGVYAIFAELLIGSQGHLFNLTVNQAQISLRKGLFAAVILSWLICLSRKQGLEFFQSKFLPYYAGLFVFIILGAASGLLYNPTASWFADFNGWLFFLLAPAVGAAINNFERVKQVLAIFFGGLVFLSVKTFLLLALFAYSQPEFIDRIYHWLRGSLLSEPTFIAGNLYRVFMQSQLYVLAGFLTAFVLLFFYERLAINRKFLWLALGLSALALLISLSRSFWLGGLAGFILIAAYLLIKRKASFKTMLANVSLVLAIFAVLAVLLQTLTGNFVQAAMGLRVGKAIVDPAGQSRLQQHWPLLSQIRLHPLIGSGFGAQVSYYSSDPRALADQPDGLYTTYAFEWGYLDIWLKIGLLGCLAYLLLLFKIGQAGLASGPLGIALSAGLLAIIIASVFSPYLNHPLGIGYLMFSSAIISVLRANYGKS